MITREDPYIRLEAALALHDLAPNDTTARAAVVALALDRTIECDWRRDLVDRWSRTRALAAALDWGGLVPKVLCAHVLAPETERPELLAEAQRRLAETTDALTDGEAEDAWGRILDDGPARDVLTAVRHLVFMGRIDMKARLLAVLDRIATAPDVDARDLARSRQLVEEMRFRATDGK